MHFIFFLFFIEVETNILQEMKTKRYYELVVYFKKDRPWLSELRSTTKEREESRKSSVKSLAQISRSECPLSVPRCNCQLPSLA